MCAVEVKVEAVHPAPAVAVHPAPAVAVNPTPTVAVRARLSLTGVPHGAAAKFNPLQALGKDDPLKADVCFLPVYYAVMIVNKRGIVYIIV